MKKLLFIVALFFPLFSFAQRSSNIQLEWSTTDKKITNKSFQYSIKVIGCDNQNVYAYFCPDDYGYFDTPKELIRYNFKTGIIDSKIYDLETDKKEREFEFIILWKGKTYLFSSFQDKKEKKHYLYAQTISKDSLSLNNDLIKVAEMDYAGESKKRPAKFDYKFSADSSKVLIHYILTDKNDEILRSGFDVLEEGCKRVWGDNNISTGLPGYFLFQKFIVNNSGDIFLGGINYKSKKEMNSEEGGNYYVLAFSQDQKKAFPYAIALPKNKYPVSTEIKINNDSELFCTGFFSQIGMSNAVGIFSAKINVPEQTISDLKIKNFDFNFLSKGMDEKEIEDLKKKMKKGNDYEDYGYVIRSKYFCTNGTYTVVAEKIRTLVIVTRDKSGTSRSYHNYHGDIVVANFKESDLSLNWIEKIPRDLHVSDHKRAFGSIGVVFTKENAIKVFYNTMKKGMFTGQGKPSKSELVVITIDKGGKQSGKKVHSAGSNKVVIQPSYIQYLQSGDIVMLGKKGYMKMKFVTIKSN